MECEYLLVAVTMHGQGFGNMKLFGMERFYVGNKIKAPISELRSFDDMDELHCH